MRSPNEAPNLPPRLVAVTSQTAVQGTRRVRLTLGTVEEPGFLGFGLDVPSAHALQSAIARSALSEGIGAPCVADVLAAFEVDGETPAPADANGLAPFAVAFGAAPFCNANGEKGVVAYVQEPGERAVAWVVTQPKMFATDLLRAAALVQYAEDNPDRPVPSP